MHADAENLRNYVLGTLDDERAADIAAHLEGCPVCEETVRNLEAGAEDTFVQALRTHPQEDGVADDTGYQQFMARIQALGQSAPAAADMPAADDGGPVFLGQYQLLGKIGQGGMGVVYKALHRSLKRVVALKMLPAADLPDGDALDRFRREMEAVGRLAHPNVVLAHDAGEADGRHFLVVEYVEGLDLADVLRRLGPWRVADACEAVRQSAAGLQAAHELGLVHRDVKPSNLMLAKGGVVKVLDLGLALLSTQHAGGGVDLTTTGQIMGTLDYMAPEQADDSHRVDIRADVYSLGATLYKLLTGRAPLAGQSAATAVQKLRALALGEPPPLSAARPEVPAALAAVVHRMLSKSPAERFATPQDAADALAPFCQDADLAGLLAAAHAHPEPQAEPAAPGDTVPMAFAPDNDTPPVSAGRSRSLAVAAQAAHSRRTGRRPMTLALLAGVILLAGVVFIIRDRDGNEKLRFTLERGDQVGFEEQARGTTGKSPGAGEWIPTPAQQAFFNQVTKLPAEEQVQAVRKKLMEVNLIFDGKITHQIDAGRVVALEFLTDQVTAIWPVRALADLERLSCRGTANNGSGGKLSDLSPLSGMKLTSLNCGDTRVADLSPLKGMPLTKLECYSTQVSDLSPLAGLKLTYLNCRTTQVADLSPLKGMPLTSLFCHDSDVSDLSPLRGMPLTELNCSGTHVSDLSPLKGMKLTVLCCAATHVSDLSPLRGLSLTILYCNETRVSDLSPLRGMPLERFVVQPRLFHEPDERLVRSLPQLTELGSAWEAWKTPEAFWQEFAARREAAVQFATATAKLFPQEQITAVADRLTTLNGGAEIGFGPVVSEGRIVAATLTLPGNADGVTPLRALMGLKTLTIQAGPHWLDLSPINSLPVEELTCSEAIALRNAPVLRGMENLGTINGKPAAEFWREIDAKPDAAAKK